MQQVKLVVFDNKNYQTDYLYINSMIGLNIIYCSIKFKVDKLINLGSACIYPKKTTQPIKENFYFPHTWRKQMRDML